MSRVEYPGEGQQELLGRIGNQTEGAKGASETEAGGVTYRNNDSQKQFNVNQEIISLYEVTKVVRGLLQFVGNC